MKIYTKAGDKGTTGLYGDKRVQKSSEIIALVGSLDTANSKLGEVRALYPEYPHKEDGINLDFILKNLQSSLFCIGAEIVDVREKYEDPIRQEEVETLEALIDMFSLTVPPLRTFILPAGNRLAASLFSARALIREAELRYWQANDVYAGRVISLMRENTQIPLWLNRCSDLLFMMARYANFSRGQKEIPWTPRFTTES